MPQVRFSSIFGGQAAAGDAATEAGTDLMVQIGGGGKPYVIDRIIATYGLKASQGDYDNPATGLRSFVGRLSVVSGLFADNLYNGVNPNAQLFSRYPQNYGSVLFDKLIHSFKEEHIFDFPNSGYGALQVPAEGATVILLVPSMFNIATAAFTGQAVQMLHVSARLSDTTAYIGEHRIND